MHFILIFILCLLHTYICAKSIITLPLYRFYERNYNEVYTSIYNTNSVIAFYDLYYTNSIATQICFGNENVQCLYLNIESLEYSTWVISSKAKHDINQIPFYTGKSDTYYMKDTSYFRFPFNKFENAYLSYETISFPSYSNKICINDFFFLLTENYKKLNANSGVLGLSMFPYDAQQVLGSNFIYQLKKKKLISTYKFAIEFKKLNEGFIEMFNEGELILGTNTDDIVFYENANVKESVMSWGCSFDKYGIQYDNTNNNNNNNETHIEYFNESIIVNVHIEFGFIVASPMYYEKIKQIFFDKYESLNKCTKYEVKNNFYGYICDDDINLNEYPNIVFENKQYRIILTAHDIFIKSRMTLMNNKLICMILFPMKQQYLFKKRWRLGAPFFAKQKMLFEWERKHLGFVFPKTNINNILDPHYKREFPYQYLTTILKRLIVLMLCIIVLCFICYGILIYRRKCLKKRQQAKYNKYVDYSLSN